jgi:hypothetical protein
MIHQNAILQEIAVHYVGNPTNNEALILSRVPLQPDDELRLRLRDYFLKHFKSDGEIFHFYHPTALQYNEMYNFCGEALTGHRDFLDISVSVARHLQGVSEHPMIKSGEMYFCKFSNIFIDNQPVDAIGIFKTETRSGFLEVKQQESKFELTYKEGIDLQKLDKACLVIDRNFEDGFEVLVIDQANKGEEARYWLNDFLRVEPIKNEYHHTKALLQLTKNFVTQQLAEDLPVEKADQIDMLNRSVSYFKSHETFDRLEFENEVFKNEEVKSSFRAYGEREMAAGEVDLQERFDISSTAVKQQARVFKSVLKLDKNFHIYIHGDRNLIEKGREDDGRKFYKIYFDQEA